MASITSLLTPERIDTARSAANLFFSVAQPLAGQAAYLTRRGESVADRSRRVSNPVTPAPGAFAIWGPLFLSGLNFAVRGATADRRHSPALRGSGWLTALAFAGNTAWELQATYRGRGWASVGIISATAAAANTAMLVAARAEDGPGRRLLLETAAPLAGWLTVATAANLAGTRIEKLGRPDAPREQGEALMLVGAAAAGAAALSYAARGNGLFAGAAAWGLGGIVVRNVRQEPRVAALAAGGIALVALATLAARKAR